MWHRKRTWLAVDTGRGQDLKILLFKVRGTLGRDKWDLYKTYKYCLKKDLVLREIRVFKSIE